MRSTLSESDVQTGSSRKLEFGKNTIELVFVVVVAAVVGGVVVYVFVLFYAHIEVVVTFLVVNFLGFLVITRHHEDLLV